VKIAFVGGCVKMSKWVKEPGQGAGVRFVHEHSDVTDVFVLTASAIPTTICIPYVHIHNECEPCQTREVNVDCDKTHDYSTSPLTNL